MIALAICLLIAAFLARYFARQADAAWATSRHLRDLLDAAIDLHSSTMRELTAARALSRVHAPYARRPPCVCGARRDEHLRGKQTRLPVGGCGMTNCPEYRPNV